MISLLLIALPWFTTSTGTGTCTIDGQRWTFVSSCSMERWCRVHRDRGDCDRIPECRELDGCIIGGWREGDDR